MSTSTSPTAPESRDTRFNSPFLSKEMVKESLTPKMIKDIKFGISGFTVMVIILFHYAWIMKRLLMNPHLSTSLIVGYFVFFGANVLFLGYVLLYVLYPVIFIEEIEQERMDKHKKVE